MKCMQANLTYPNYQLIFVLDTLVVMLHHPTIKGESIVYTS